MLGPGLLSLYKLHLEKPWGPVLYICASFTRKALAAAALGLHWGDTVMLYEVMLWLHYGSVWLLSQPGERLCYGCHASQERINVSSSYGSSHLLPAS